MSNLRTQTTTERRDWSKKGCGRVKSAASHVCRQPGIFVRPHAKQVFHSRYSILRSCNCLCLAACPICTSFNNFLYLRVTVKWYWAGKNTRRCSKSVTFLWHPWVHYLCVPESSKWWIASLRLPRLSKYFAYAWCVFLRWTRSNFVATSSALSHSQQVCANQRSRFLSRWQKDLFSSSGLLEEGRAHYIVRGNSLCCGLISQVPRTYLRETVTLF